MDSKMDKDHKRDYAAKKLFDGAVRAIDAVLASEDAASRLGVAGAAELEMQRDQLAAKSDRIVAVWD